MNPVRVPVCRVQGTTDIPLPQYETSGAAGFDLRAAIVGPIVLSPGERAVVPTGLRVAIPVGYEGQVRPRSGQAARRGLGMVNAPGTIDSDYRGEIMVIMINWSSENQTIDRGDRIGQLVIAPVAHAEIVEVTELDDTDRGHGGFGHTGK